MILIIESERLAVSYSASRTRLELEALLSISIL